MSMDDFKDWPGGAIPPKNRGERKRIAAPTGPLVGRGKDWTVGSKTIRMFTIGDVAELLNRSQVTIRSWEDKGWLPSASYRTPPPAGVQAPGKAVQGRRLYTEHQVLMLLDAAQRFNLDDVKTANMTAFAAHVHKHWNNH